MVISLLGLLQEGSDRSPRVPGSGVQPVELPIGAHVQLRLQVRTVGNVPLRLTGTTLKLSVKRSFLDSVPLVTLQGAALAGVEASWVAFDLLPAVTKPLAPGRYVYDVWRIAGADRDRVVPLSPLVLLATVVPATN